MKLASSSFADNKAIPAEFAFCAPDLKTHCTQGANRNPRLAWSDAPAAAKSLAPICHDCDVPSKGDDVNQEGRKSRHRCRAWIFITGCWLISVRVPAQSGRPHARKT
jgi:phosphatidylethanolamine-binding protein (PEBP) family uncharacterized protein